MAAALHDVDDRKFYPDNRKYENARTILAAAQVPSHDIIKMISLVSCSTNGNSIDPDIPDYFYYPRYADRVAACGVIGLQRCRDYSVRQGLPMYTSDTFMATCVADLYSDEMMAQFAAYSQGGKQSASMMDHMYDAALIRTHRKCVL